MSEGWIALIVCIVVVVSGALPLLRDRDRRHDRRRQAPPPLPPRPEAAQRETLRDWRSGE
ncbi:MAG: hypothetical protein H3C26_18490 [Rhodocyclaceae bacterium]|nr:hypothetical protein [Rhodocyclaceae bacterium]